MYILKQQSPTLAQDFPDILEVASDSNASSLTDSALPPGYYIPGQPPYQTNPDIHTIAIFVQITWVLWFAFILLMMCRGLYAKYGNADDNSDSESDISDSAWRGEDSSLPSPARASKHRKRLKKLEQVAPSQSLQHWRTGKTEEQVQTFATVSLTLSCAICLENLEDNEQIRELRCGHIYHANCLNMWVERGHHDCPLCKYDMLGLNKSTSKPPLSVSRSATRTDLNTTAVAGHVGRAQDVIVQIDDDSYDSDFMDDSDDSD